MLAIAELLKDAYTEVQYMDFYRDVFPEGSFEEKGVYEDGKYNGIAVLIMKGKGSDKGKDEEKVKRYTITDELDAIREMAATDRFCFMSPISYAGKNRSAKNARFMYALTIDLDGISTMKEWECLVEQIENGHNMLFFTWGLPKPTYLVASGTGVHIYYVFEKPIPLFKNIVEQLEILKRRLTWQAWTQGASTLREKVQYESLFQGFRVVGTITKTGSRCRAFKVGDKVTIEYLNKYVPEDYRVKTFTYKSELTLEEAKKKYPIWYKERVIEGRPKKTWKCKKDLYNWWLRKLESVEEGHRYWAIMTLATYAKKCGVPRKELEKDAYGLVPFMNTKGDSFTEEDVLHALEAYTDSYVTYPIDTIVERTGIPIQKNKRNGRKQVTHLKIARFTLETMNEDRGEVLQGRPKGSSQQKEIVMEWREQHPDGKKADCIRDTGLSKPTVYRWWEG